MNHINKGVLQFPRLKLYFIFSLILSFIFVSCSSLLKSEQFTPQPTVIQDVVLHNSFSENVELLTWNQNEGGITIYDSSQAGLGFVRPEDRNTSPNFLQQNEEFNIDSDEPFSLDLVINAAKDSTFLVSVILDYNQISFTLDGQYGLLHEIKVEKDGFLYIPIQIDINEPGAHDLMILGFREPYDRPKDHVTRNLSGGLLVGRRAVVIVDGVTEPVKDITPDVYGVDPPADVDFGLRVMFANMPASSKETSHPSDPKRQMKLVASGETGEIFKYQIWLSNYDLPDNSVDYGLIRFLDFHQVDFVDQDFFIAHFNGRKETILEDSLMIPSPGIHEIQIVYVFDPYRSILHDEVLAPFIFSSSPLGIIAE